METCSKMEGVESESSSSDEDETKATNNQDINSESSEDEEEKLLQEKRAEELEKVLADDKYVYDAHVELVDLYRKLADLNSMRLAYQRFHENFPLTPSLWLTWIRDEINLASSPKEKKRVLDLFEEAVEDYLSVELWLEYVQFSIGLGDLDATREIIERGLTSAGLHVSQGHLLWDTFRELELAHLSLLEPKSESWQKQLSRVATVYKRQLSVPLLDMESTYQEWKNWVEEVGQDPCLNEKAVEWGYGVAKKLLEKWTSHEDLLREAEGTEQLFEAYRSYIKVVDDPAHILCLYERAVEQLSLCTELWVDYSSYAMHLGNEVSLKVVKRALRNCPWCSELWVIQMRVLQLQDKEEAEIMSCFEEGLASLRNSSTLDLWLSYIEYSRRAKQAPDRIHKLFKQAYDTLGKEGDPTYKLLRWQARCFAQEKDTLNFRLLWTEMLRDNEFKANVAAWFEYLDLERQHGKPEDVRNIYKRAIFCCPEWAHYLGDEWLLFERHSGTVVDVQKCAETVKKSLKTVTERQSVPKRRRQDTNYEYETKKRPKREIAVAPEPTKKPTPADIDSQRSVFLSNMRSNVDETRLKQLFPTATQICIPTHRNGQSKCYAYVEFASADEAKQALARDREPIDGRPLYVSECKSESGSNKPTFKYANALEKNKLFVRGLPLTCSENDVAEYFRPHGSVAVRLVCQKSGRSKGLAYVEFPDEAQAEKALRETDQKKFGNRIISVSISAPPPKKEAAAAGAFDVRRNARTKLAVPLIPRAVQKTIPSTSQKPLSNEDFRKMAFKNA